MVLYVELGGVLFVVVGYDDGEVVVVLGIMMVC